MLRRVSLKKTPFKRKPKVVDREAIDEMNNFFLSIWKKRVHYCTICGAWLGNEPRSYMFDHILEKHKYPELKLEEKNIALLCLDCHDCKSRGIYPVSYAIIIQKTKELFGIQ